MVMWLFRGPQEAQTTVPGGGCGPAGAEASDDGGVLTAANATSESHGGATPGSQGVPTRGRAPWAS